jgi:hypothetical protein
MMRFVNMALQTDAKRSGPTGFAGARMCLFCKDLEEIQVSAGRFGGFWHGRCSPMGR